ncbi:MAG: hypothetical protein WEB62_10155, partial [Bacteroidota bacterium]
LRISASYAFAAMLSGWLTSTVSLIVGTLNTINGVPEYLFGIEPMYPGLIVALSVWGAGRMWGRREGTQ